MNGAGALSRNQKRIFMLPVCVRGSGANEREYGDRHNKRDSNREGGRKRVEEKMKDYGVFIYQRVNQAYNDL